MSPPFFSSLLSQPRLLFLACPRFRIKLQALPAAAAVLASSTDGANRGFAAAASASASASQGANGSSSRSGKLAFGAAAATAGALAFAAAPLAFAEEEADHGKLIALFHLLFFCACERERERGGSESERRKREELLKTHIFLSRPFFSTLSLPFFPKLVSIIRSPPAELPLEPLGPVQQLRPPGHQARPPSTFFAHFSFSVPRRNVGEREGDERTSKKNTDACLFSLF